ncbi:efflux RND transporter periplasmic adaptor subunit [Paractinoplanes rishiriensis]|uniref:Multidrug resistance protein MdtA-like barrel-sandwich hybrid domain-containing protein n=1 Tax=Paractinoplanes rishiriensis TaxID=1050105 RepID=A0A919JTM0_9ACTN|nr:efflux RND transporter periplasmic adaptor subunit [Actinoplanes rishiriensis]GIE94966.1 hypothetical protein Ari01nite_24310 [Actinoplanes rishiriensis]
MGEVLVGRRRLLWVVAAVVALALVTFLVVRAVTAGATDKPAAVSTAAADRGPVSTAVATTGTVRPAQTRSLGFTVEGAVDSVAVRAGTMVTAGQVLATVDDAEAAAAVSSAQDTLTEARAALTEARAAATTSPTASTACGSNVAAAYGTGNLSPTPTVTASPSPSPTRTASPRPGVAPSRTATRTSGPAPTTRSSGGPQDCGGGQNTGGGPGGGGDAILSAEQRVTTAITAVEKAEEALAGATIRAPIAGRVLTVAGKVGSQVGAGATFITLADIYDMQVSANFPEADADRLAIGQKGAVTLADRPGEEFAATVVQVDPVGTSDGTMVRYGLLLAFDEAPEDLLVGQSAPVRVTTGAKSEVLRVPSTAVHDVRGDTGTVLRDGARVTVGVGLRGDRYTEITAGLRDGDLVVRSW